jgi:hypothetical protein
MFETMESKYVQDTRDLLPINFAVLLLDIVIVVVEHVYY